MVFDPNFAFRNLDSQVGIKRLVKLIATLDEAGRMVILRAISSELSEAKKQQVLMLLRQHVATTDAAVRGWLVDGITASYVAGANFATKSLRSISFAIPAGAPPLSPIDVTLLRSAPYMKPHLDTVNNLLSSSYLDFGNALGGYLRGAEQILNDALKRQIRSTIAQGRLEGSSIDTIAEAVKTNMGDQGFTVLLDRGGRRWELESYSEMLTRTHINRAANEAAINRMGDYGVDIVEVSSHNCDCKICAEEEGKIYSISGKSESYEPLAGHDLPFHPNCTHNLIPRPDLT